MTIQETRLENLRQLVLEYGTATRVAELAATAENHLNQVLRGARLPSGKKRGIGDDLARKLEAGCGKPVGWMDTDHSANNLPPQDAQFINEIRQDVAIYDVPEHVRQAVLTLITSSPKKTDA